MDVTGVAAPPPGPGNDPEEIYQQGVRLARKGQWHLAENRLLRGWSWMEKWVRHTCGWPGLLSHEPPPRGRHSLEAARKLNYRYPGLYYTAPAG